MKYSRFEELPVWQDAAAFFLDVQALGQRPLFHGRASFRDQLERATLSISNNIAEGFERGSNAELLNFLYIAKGSAGEVRSMLAILARMPDSAGLTDEISSLRKKAESISRQLGAWVESIKNSANKGDKFVNDKTRQPEKFRRDRDEFWQDLRQSNAANLERLSKQRQGS